MKCEGLQLQGAVMYDLGYKSKLVQVTVYLSVDFIWFVSTNYLIYTPDVPVLTGCLYLVWL